MATPIPHSDTHVTPPPRRSAHSWFPRPWRSHFAAQHPKLYLVLHLLGGMAATWALVWGFLEIAAELPDADSMVRFDQFVARWFEAHNTDPGEAAFTAVSWLGSPLLWTTVIVALALFAYRRQWLRAGALVIAAGGGWLLNDGLKYLFHRGRPQTASEFIHHTSWSFPSGHAMDSIVCFGFLMVMLLESTRSPRARAWIIASTVLLVGLVGFSRLYLGVHYVSDVIGGYVAGAAWLAVCLTGYWLVHAKRELIDQ